MVPKEYFLTWNRQVGAVTMAVSGAQRDEFILEDGKRVYDFTSTSFQTSFGHTCDPIRQRIHQQLDAMPIAHGLDVHLAQLAPMRIAQRG